MARFRIALIATLILLLSACQPQGPETTIHRWDQATWDTARWQ
jgi:hypothetical protein